MGAMLDRKLEIFRMAATLNHFSDAAAALGMTQPNVTSQIARLEEELGVRLFERDGRRVRLTAAGRALLEESETLLEDAAAVLRKVRNAAGSIQEYRIGATMTAGGYLLPEAVAAYMRSFPREKLELFIANTDEIAGLLKVRRLDLGLVEGPFDSGIFMSERLLEDEMFAVAAPGSVPENFSLREYLSRGGRFVLREPGSGTRFHFDRFLAEHGLPEPSAECTIIANSFDAIKHLVRAGYGITVISEHAVHDELASGTLVASRFSEGRIRRGIDFIYPNYANLQFAGRFIPFCRRRIAASLSTGE